MDDTDLHKPGGFAPDTAKSIFPTFNVNVPMPRDTAVPGSYPSEPSGVGGIKAAGSGISGSYSPK